MTDSIKNAATGFAVATGVSITTNEDKMVWLALISVSSQIILKLIDKYYGRAKSERNKNK